MGGWSIGAYLEALRLKPDSPEILTHLGVVFMDARLVSAAETCLERAILLAPQYPSAHWNRGLLSLLKGNYDLGWTEYEWRWKLPHVIGRSPGQLPPRWDGRKLSGESVLVFPEQGLGDTLQFVRLVPEISKRGGTPILVCQPELKSLLSATGSFGTIIGANERPPRTDYSVALLSLPAILRTVRPEATSIPYFFVDSVKAGRWSARLGDLPGLKVGVVWAGSARADDVLASSIDRRRSVSLARMAPLFHMAGCSFVSLQKGPPQQEIRSSNVNIVDLGDELNDFSDTAALVANLDLVISVDTSVVHLCGALGRPVWMLSRYDGCWRWLLDRSDSPWYPSLKIFRQHRPHAWDSVIQAVAIDLQRFSANCALR